LLLEKSCIPDCDSVLNSAGNLNGHPLGCCFLSLFDTLFGYFSKSSFIMLSYGRGQPCLSLRCRASSLLGPGGIPSGSCYDSSRLHTAAQMNLIPACISKTSSSSNDHPSTSRQIWCAAMSRQSSEWKVLLIMLLPLLLIYIKRLTLRPCRLRFAPEKCSYRFSSFLH
jgi:hypothetical protein